MFFTAKEAKSAKEILAWGIFQGFLLGALGVLGGSFSFLATLKPPCPWETIGLEICLRPFSVAISPPFDPQFLHSRPYSKDKMGQIPVFSQIFLPSIFAVSCWWPTGKRPCLP